VGSVIEKTRNEKVCGNGRVMSGMALIVLQKYFARLSA
jgi:hypothetical protein